MTLLGLFFTPLALANPVPLAGCMHGGAQPTTGTHAVHVRWYNGPSGALLGEDVAMGAFDACRFAVSVDLALSEAPDAGLYVSVALDSGLESERVPVGASPLALVADRAASAADADLLEQHPASFFAEASQVDAALTGLQSALEALDQTVQNLATDTEAAHSHSASSGGAGAHTHTVTVDAVSANATSASASNVPPYLGFVKIIRIY